MSILLIVLPDFNPSLPVASWRTPKAHRHHHDGTGPAAASSRDHRSGGKGPSRRVAQTSSRPASLSGCLLLHKRRRCAGFSIPTIVCSSLGPCRPADILAVSIVWHRQSRDARCLRAPELRSAATGAVCRTGDRSSSSTRTRRVGQHPSSI